MRNAIIAIAVIAILAVGGWAIFGRSTDNTNNSSKTSSTNSPAQNQSPASTNAVTIQNFAFSPASITVKKDTMVTWTNKDSTAHTVTADSGNGPASQPLQPGQSYSFTYNQTGTFTYHCSIHPEMHGTVVVTDTTSATPSSNNSTTTNSNPSSPY